MATGATVGIRGGVPRRTATVERDVFGLSAGERARARPLRNEREEGAGQCRGAQSNAKAHPGSFAIASRGDSAGMGRGDTSEPVRRDAGILEARSGVAGFAAAGEAGSKIEGGTARRFLTRLALASVRGYQIFLGPFFGGSCKFHPSCSQYTYEAIQRFDVRRGVWLGLKRFLRCRPFSAGGHDPVPEILPNKRDARASAEVAN